MRLRTLFILIVLAAIGAFSILNWNAFITPTPLSLGFVDIEAPLGLVMLGLLVFLTALFLVFIVFLQTSVLLEARRHSRDLKASQALAEKTETSRFTELKFFLDGELKKLTSAGNDSTVAMKARMDQLERDLRSAVEQSGNTVAAYIGQVEDRLERGGSNLAPRPPT
jgi:hypothetical protein